MRRVAATAVGLAGRRARGRTRAGGRRALAPRPSPRRDRRLAGAGGGAGRAAARPALRPPGRGRDGGRRTRRERIPATPGLRTPTLTAPLPAGAHTLRLRLAGSPRRRCVVRVGAPTPVPRAIPLGAAMRSENLDDPDYARTFLDNFDSLTPEHEMKWAVRSSPCGACSTSAAPMRWWTSPPPTAARCAVTRWSPSKPLPGWLVAPLLPWTRDQLIAILHAHIAAVVGRYRGRVAEWDVVNEAFAPDGSLARQRVAADDRSRLHRARRSASPTRPTPKRRSTSPTPAPSGRDASRTRSMPWSATCARTASRSTAWASRTTCMANRYPSRGRPGGRVPALRAPAGLRTQITEMDVDLAGDRGARRPPRGPDRRLLRGRARPAPRWPRVRALHHLGRLGPLRAGSRLRRCRCSSTTTGTPRPAYDAVALALARRPGPALTASRAPATPRRAAAASPRR